MKLIEQSNSTLLAYRNEGELPFAEIHPPKLTNARAWGVKYRDSRSENPFDHFNVCPKTLEDVNYELEKAIKYGSDKQLGLDKA
jgi:hypothetical protein